MRINSIEYYKIHGEYKETYFVQKSDAGFKAKKWEKVLQELEEKIDDVKLRRKAVEQDAITLENIYTLLANFDRIYDKISDEEKKSLISSLIKEIEIFPCDETELPLKSILFNFPVYKDGADVCEFLWDKRTHVSTCVELLLLMSAVML